MFAEFQTTLQVTSYIAHPYWPEADELINIQKCSGLNRLKNEDKRQAALRSWLDSQGLTMKDYDRLVVLAARQWYRQDGETSEIVIPRHQLSGCLVQAVKSAPAGARIPGDSLRSLLQLSDFTTGKMKMDEKFKRFVRPSDGTGKPLSNQRSLRCNEVIKNFEATGTISVDTTAVAKPEESIGKLLDHAGKFIGVGAARKMGYGRFTVTQFTNK